MFSLLMTSRIQRFVHIIHERGEIEGRIEMVCSVVVEFFDVRK